MQYLTTRMLLWPTTRTTIAEEGRPKTKTSHYPISPASSLVVFFDAVSDDEEDNSVADIDGYTAPTEGLHGRPSNFDGFAATIAAIGGGTAWRLNIVARGKVRSWTLRNLALEPMTITEFMGRSWPTRDEALAMNESWVQRQLSPARCAFFAYEPTPKPFVYYSGKFKGAGQKLVIIDWRTRYPTDIESVDAVENPDIRNSTVKQWAL
eukprot:CAMPEP_0194037770 /NCGR_PEP_ID=MMETSP0009_2-20130614/10097_1 /TAXON_ID=210454 /ORGANISM="Grammatophora oceanica, Strain CCMP 410" /LENGTH=207 /DNA_ID=CAMNT_0038680055 /DNA_START=692 /DNA_END=1313 /DNA_ORIENTATION=+